MKSGKPSKPKWAVGVVTAPRQNVCHLDRTLESLTRAGWENIVVFAEPESPVPKGYDVVRRRKQYGDWSNWATALFDLLLSEPDADYIFMAEDDSVLCRGAKDYLDKTLFHLGEFATVSLYCPSKYAKEDLVGFHNVCEGWQTWSTLTVIMDKHKVAHFFSAPFVQKHRFEHIFPLPEDQIQWGVQVDPKNSCKDSLLGMWAARNNWPMLYHTPSLAQHTGLTSTLTHEPTRKENLAFDFVGEDFVPDWPLPLTITHL